MWYNSGFLKSVNELTYHYIYSCNWLGIKGKDNDSNHKLVKVVGKFQSQQRDNMADSMTLFFSFNLHSETFVDHSIIWNRSLLKPI